jgi:3-hydroxyacyl-CoA dehydrogenase
MGLTIEEVDKLTGRSSPKATQNRIVDDTLVHVANGIYENCPNDEATRIVLNFQSLSTK